MTTIKEYLQKNESNIFNDIEKLVRAESPTLDKKLADQCADLLTNLFHERLGLEAEVLPQQEVGNHLRFVYGSGDDQLLLLGHYDTVWEEGQLPFRIEGNKAYGPGIFDMKAGVVQAMWAVKACRELDIPLSKSVVFLCTGDEEISSPTSREWIEQESLRSSAVLVTEPATVPSGALKTGRKGVGRFKLYIKGRASHSGSHHEDGISAVEEMAHQIRYLHSLTDYAKGTTLNVGVARGGTRVNVVAEKAELDIDLRFQVTEEGERVAQFIQNLQPHLPGITLQVEGGITRPAMERTPQIAKLFQTAAECGKELGLTLKEEQAGGGSDANFSAALGIPTIDGLGPVGAGAHAEHEHILIDRIVERTALLSKLIVRLAGAK